MKHVIEIESDEVYFILAHLMAVGAGVYAGDLNLTICPLECMNVAKERKLINTSDFESASKLGAKIYGDSHSFIPK